MGQQVVKESTDVTRMVIIKVDGCEDALFLFSLRTSGGSALSYDKHPTDKFCPSYELVSANQK